MARSLNRVQLIGNLTRDPELRYTPQGTAVCSFGLATNRSWTTESGEKRDEAEFHRIVSWNKLAELCSQFLTKGRKVFLEGRLSTRSWNSQDGTQRQATEIIISDMILLDSPTRRTEEAEESEPAKAPEAKPQPAVPKERKSVRQAGDKQTDEAKSQPSEKKEEIKEDSSDTSKDNEDEVTPEDIPF